MFRILLRIIFLILIISQNSIAETKDVTLILSTPKQVYEFGESIFVTVVIKNNDSKPWHLMSDVFARPAEQLLNIYNPHGVRITTLRHYPKYFIDENPVLIRLAPGQSHSIQIDLTDHFPNTYPTGMPHNFDEPGKYMAKAQYRVDHQFKIIPSELWMKTIESKPIEFIVKPLEGKRLSELLGQMQSENHRIRTEALSLIRRGNAIQYIDNILMYLEKEQPSEMRREAANALYEYITPKYFETYINYLDDPDASVRGYMALALGKLGNPAAGDALYKVCDPLTYPESYGAAFKALIQLNDPHLIEVARHIQRYSPSQAIRMMAEQVINDRQE